MYPDSNYSISVVIPNYNGRRLLQKNLPTVFAALKQAGVTYEVIIPDDASTDDSIAFIRKNYPEIIIIAHQKNGGFSININSGIRVAKMDMVLLLNSDIKLNPDYFLAQLHFFNLPDTFGVMGQIRDEADDTVAEACKYPLRSLFKINHFKNIPLGGGEPVYTFYLSGANALVDRKKLTELGGFNELFSPFYQEDLDLSLRAWESGWKCYYQNQSVCLHSVSSTINNHHTKNSVKIISTRNKFMLHYLHHRGARLYVWGGVTLLFLSIRWVTGRNYYYPATVLFLKKWKVLRAYKHQYMQGMPDKPAIPYIVVKNKIRRYLDEIVNIKP